MEPRCRNWGTFKKRPKYHYKLAPIVECANCYGGAIPFSALQLHWNHDDVIKWKHFPHNWPFVRGIHRSPVNSSHKGQWRGSLIFSLICVWINDWVNNREAGDLRGYRAHCDVIVMTKSFLFKVSLTAERNTRIGKLSRWPRCCTTCSNSRWMDVISSYTFLSWDYMLRS